MPSIAIPTYTVNIVRGKHWSDTIQLMKPDRVTPRDVTGLSFALAFRTTHLATTNAFTASVMISDANDGILFLEVLASATSNLTEPVHYGLLSSLNAGSQSVPEAWVVAFTPPSFS